VKMGITKKLIVTLPLLVGLSGNTLADTHNINDYLASLTIPKQCKYLVKERELHIANMEAGLEINNNSSYDQRMENHRLKILDLDLDKLGLCIAYNKSRKE